MEYFILFTIIVVIIALIRVQNASPKSKRRHQTPNGGETGYWWFPWDSGGGGFESGSADGGGASGGDGFDGGSADGGGGDSSSF